MANLVIFACSTFLSACVLLHPLSAYSSPSITPLHKCDTFGAHPDDNNRWAEGVTDEDLLLQPVKAYCFQALRKYPNEPRFLFQLGRGQLKDNNLEQAFTAFRKAAKQKYAPAQAYLGVMYEYGYAVEPNKQFAAKLYESAYNNGFGPAYDFLQELLGVTEESNPDENLEFDLSGYQLPNLVGKLYSGDFDSIPDNTELRAQILSFNKSYSELCSRFETSYIHLGFEEAIFEYSFPLLEGKLDGMFKELPSLLESFANSGNAASFGDMIKQQHRAALSFEKSMAMFRAEGTHDGRLFHSQYQCSGTVPSQFIENLFIYISSRSKHQPEPYTTGDNDKIYYMN